MIERRHSSSPLYPATINRFARLPHGGFARNSRLRPSGLTDLLALTKEIGYGSFHHCSEPHSARPPPRTLRTACTCAGPARRERYASHLVNQTAHAPARIASSRSGQVLDSGAHGVPTLGLELGVGWWPSIDNRGTAAGGALGGCPGRSRTGTGCPIERLGVAHTDRRGDPS